MLSEVLIWLLAVAWIFLMLVILLLNLPVGFIFWSSQQLQSPRNMYIGSMILSDILLGLMIPVKIYTIQAQRDNAEGTTEVCHVALIVQTFLKFVNLYSILGLTIVRHRHITMPFAQRQKRRQALYFILFYWLASLLSSIRVPYITVDESLEDHYICLSPMKFKPNMMLYAFFMDYCFPIATIYLLCFHADRYLKSHRVIGDPMEGAASNRRDCRVVKMVLYLVNCFVVLQFPIQFINLYAYFTGEDLHTWFQVGQLLMFSTGASNIIVYAFFNRRAATVFLHFMKFHRGSQVGVIGTAETTLNPSAEPKYSLGDRISLAVTHRFSQISRSSTYPVLENTQH